MSARSLASPSNTILSLGIDRSRSRPVVTWKERMWLMYLRTDDGSRRADDQVANAISVSSVAGHGVNRNSDVKWVYERTAVACTSHVESFLARKKASRERCRIEVRAASRSWPQARDEESRIEIDGAAGPARSCANRSFAAAVEKSSPSGVDRGILRRLGLTDAAPVGSALAGSQRRVRSPRAPRWAGVLVALFVVWRGVRLRKCGLLGTFVIGGLLATGWTRCLPTLSRLMAVVSM